MPPLRCEPAPSAFAVDTRRKFAQNMGGVRRAAEEAARQHAVGRLVAAAWRELLEVGAPHLFFNQLFGHADGERRGAGSTSEGRQQKGLGETRLETPSRSTRVLGVRRRRAPRYCSRPPRRRRHGKSCCGATRRTVVRKAPGQPYAPQSRLHTDGEHEGLDQSRGRHRNGLVSARRVFRCLSDRHGSSAFAAVSQSVLPNQ